MGREGHIQITEVIVLVCAANRKDLDVEGELMEASWE